MEDLAVESVADEFFVLQKEAILFSAFSVALSDAAAEGLQRFASDVVLISASLSTMSYVSLLVSYAVVDG